MTTDVYEQEVEDGWPEVLADSHEVLDHARQAWHDEDRPVEFDDEHGREVF